jgi:hypothetical protein
MWPSLGHFAGWHQADSLLGCMPAGRGKYLQRWPPGPRVIRHHQEKASRRKRAFIDFRENRQKWRYANTRAVTGKEVDTGLAEKSSAPQNNDETLRQGVGNKSTPSATLQKLNRQRFFGISSTGVKSYRIEWRDAVSFLLLLCVVGHCAAEKDGHSIAVIGELL